MPRSPKPKLELVTSDRVAAVSGAPADRQVLPPAAPMPSEQPVETRTEAPPNTSEPDIPLDMETGGPEPGSFAEFLERIALLGDDAIETPRLRSIWRLQRNCESQIHDMGKISNPKFISKKLTNVVETLKVIERLYQELDQYRHTVVRQAVLVHGADASLAFTTKRGQTLAWSDILLESWMQDQMEELEKLTNHLECQAGELNKLNGDALRGIIQGRETGFDRSGWPDALLRFVTLIEGNNRQLREKLAGRRASLSRGLAANTAQAPKGFAIAQNVKKAAKAASSSKEAFH